MAMLAFRLLGEFYVPSRSPLISGSNLPKFSGNHCVRRDALTNRAPHPHHISRRVQSCAFKESRRSPDQKALPDEEPKDLGVRVALSMLRFYKSASELYVPTCSEYSMEAYKKYGVAKGTVLTAWRLCRCNPLGGSGFDPPRWFGEENQHEDFLD